MKKIIGTVIFSILAGCSSNQYETQYYNLHKIKGVEVICKDEKDAIRLVKMGYSASEKYQQALIFNKAKKQGLCIDVPEQDVIMTGVRVIFPITDSFPESFRGVKKVVFKVRYQGEVYWLVPTGVPKEY